MTETTRGADKGTLAQLIRFRFRKREFLQIWEIDQLFEMYRILIFYDRNLNKSWYNFSIHVDNTDIHNNKFSVNNFFICS